MPVEINPRKLRGVWQDGYALDVHTTSSVFVGYNSFGHPEFETTRSPLGELLLKLKYRGDRSVVQPIAEAVVAFVRSWNPGADSIIPVPASNTVRKNQPVLEIATAVSALAGMRLCPECISKVKKTDELKNVFDFQKRSAILKQAFVPDRALTEGRRLLLFDDLFRSGATATAVTESLICAGGASAVFLLTLTRTRSRL